jgi:chromosomal replication initiation ATPase DnaA
MANKKTHIFTFSFPVRSHFDIGGVTERELLAGLLRRVADMQDAKVGALGKACEGVSPYTAPAADKATVVNACAIAWDVPVEQILSDRRDRRFVLPRHAAMYILYEHGNLSYPEVGRLFARDHTTIIGGVRGARGKIESNDAKFIKPYSAALALIDHTEKR